jgi:DNA-binding transcriptional MerR regulator
MDNEYRTNAKKLSPEEHFQHRRSIIRLSKVGKKVKEIAEILDVSERHVMSIRPSISTQRRKKQRFIWETRQEYRIPQIIYAAMPPLAKTPIVRVEAQKLKVNILSVISPRGKVRFVIYEELTSHAGKSQIVL